MTKIAFYNNPRFRSAFYQIVVLVAVIWFGVEFFLNARANLEAQNLRFGLRFLDDPAGFNISQALIPFGLALRLYDAFSCAVQRKCTCSVARSLAGRDGRPLPRLAVVMAGLYAYTNNPCNPSLVMI